MVIDDLNERYVNFYADFAFKKFFGACRGWFSVLDTAEKARELPTDVRRDAWKALPSVETRKHLKFPETLRRVGWIQALLLRLRFIG